MAFVEVASRYKRGWLVAEIAEILAIETGSTISFATFQQDLVGATIEQAAGWMNLPKGEILETNVPGTHSIGLRKIAEEAGLSIAGAFLLPVASGAGP
jgi:hypothetical protein